MCLYVKIRKEKGIDSYQEQAVTVKQIKELCDRKN